MVYSLSFRFGSRRRLVGFWQQPIEINRIELPVAIDWMAVFFYLSIPSSVTNRVRRNAEILSRFGDCQEQVKFVGHLLLRHFNNRSTNLTKA